MDKKKAIVCSALLFIILSAVFVASILVKNGDGISFYEFISPIISTIVFPIIIGGWVGECVKKFYNWLTK